MKGGLLKVFIVNYDLKLDSKEIYFAAVYTESTLHFAYVAFYFVVESALGYSKFRGGLSLVALVSLRLIFFCIVLGRLDQDKEYKCGPFVNLCGICPIYRLWNWFYQVHNVA